MVFPSKQWDTGGTTNLSEALFDCSCLVEVRQICLKDAAICFVVMSFSLAQRTSFQRQLKCEDLRRNTWNTCVYWRILVSPKRLSQETQAFVSFIGQLFHTLDRHSVLVASDFRLCKEMSVQPLSLQSCSLRDALGLDVTTWTGCCSGLETVTKDLLLHEYTKTWNMSQIRVIETSIQLDPHKAWALASCGNDRARLQVLVGYALGLHCHRVMSHVCVAASPSLLYIKNFHTVM